MPITVNSIPTALQAIALVGVFFAIQGLINIFRNGIVATLDSRDEDRRHAYNDREPFVSRFVIYRGRAVSVAMLIVSLVVIILCGLGIAPAHFPLRIEPMQAFWYVLLTTFIGVVLVAALWLFTNKQWTGE